MAEMLDEIESLKTQISELKAMIESLVVHQCIEDECKSKLELDKINTKKLERRKSIHSKKESLKN